MGGAAARSQWGRRMTRSAYFTPEYYARMRELEAGSWWNAAMRDIAGMLFNDVQLPSSWHRTRRRLRFRPDAYLVQSLVWSVEDTRLRHSPTL